VQEPADTKVEVTPEVAPEEKKEQESLEVEMNDA